MKYGTQIFYDGYDGRRFAIFSSQAGLLQGTRRMDWNADGHDDDDVRGFAIFVWTSISEWVMMVADAASGR